MFIVYSQYQYCISAFLYKTSSILYILHIFPMYHYQYYCYYYIQLTTTNYTTPISLSLSLTHTHSMYQPSLSDVLYIGETESIRQRFKQHQDSFKKQQYTFTAAVLTLSNKSTARRVETTLINNLKKNGYDLMNQSDGHHVLFGQK